MIKRNKKIINAIALATVISSSATIMASPFVANAKPMQVSVGPRPLVLFSDSSNEIRIDYGSSRYGIDSFYGKSNVTTLYLYISNEHHWNSSEDMKPLEQFKDTLKYVHINFVDEVDVDFDFLKAYPNIENISIEGCKHQPKINFNDFNKLQYISLDDCIVNSFSYPDSVERLDFWKCDLESFNFSPSLTTMIFSNVNFKNKFNLTEAVSKCNNIQNVSFGGCTNTDNVDLDLSALKGKTALKGFNASSIAEGSLDSMNNFKGFTNLACFDISNCDVVGTLQKDTFEDINKSAEINLTGTKITGILPDLKIDKFFASNLGLTGDLRSIHLDSVKTVDVSNNNITGTFDPSINSDGYGLRLNLANNKISGELPTKIFREARYLNFENNYLIGNGKFDKRNRGEDSGFHLDKNYLEGDGESGVGKSIYKKKTFTTYIGRSKSLGNVLGELSKYYDLGVENDNDEESLKVEGTTLTGLEEGEYDVTFYAKAKEKSTLLPYKEISVDCHIKVKEGTETQGNLQDTEFKKDNMQLIISSILEELKAGNKTAKDTLDTYKQLQQQLKDLKSQLDDLASKVSGGDKTTYDKILKGYNSLYSSFVDLTNILQDKAKSEGVDLPKDDMKQDSEKHEDSSSETGKDMSLDIREINDKVSAIDKEIDSISSESSSGSAEQKHDSLNKLQALSVDLSTLKYKANGLKSNADEKSKKDLDNSVSLIDSALNKITEVTRRIKSSQTEFDVLASKISDDLKSAEDELKDCTSYLDDSYGVTKASELLGSAVSYLGSVKDDLSKCKDLDGYDDSVFSKLKDRYDKAYSQIDTVRKTVEQKAGQDVISKTVDMAKTADEIKDAIEDLQKKAPGLDNDTISSQVSVLKERVRQLGDKLNDLSQYKSEESDNVSATLTQLIDNFNKTLDVINKNASTPKEGSKEFSEVIGEVNSLTKEINNIEKDLTSGISDGCKDKLDKAKKDLEVLQEKLNNLPKGSIDDFEIQKVKSNIQTMLGRIINLMSMSNLSIDDRINELKDKVSSLENKNVDSNAVSELQSKIDSLNKEITAMSDNLRKVTDERNLLADKLDLSADTTELNNTQNQLKDMTTKYNNKVDEYNKLLSEMDKLKEDIKTGAPDTIQKLIEDKTKALEQSKADLSNAKKVIDNLTEKVNKLQSTLSKDVDKSELVKKDNQIADLSSKLSNAQNTVNQLQTALDNLKQNGSADKDVSSLQDENKKLQKELDNLKKNDNKKVVEELSNKIKKLENDKKSLEDKVRDANKNKDLSVKLKAILDKTNEDLKKAKADLDKVNKDNKLLLDKKNELIRELSSKIASNESTIKLLSATVNKYNEEKKSLASELENAKQMLADALKHKDFLANDNKNLSEKLNEVYNNNNSLKDIISNKEEQLSQITDDSNNKADVINNLEKEIEISSSNENRLKQEREDLLARINNLMASNGKAEKITMPDKVTKYVYVPGESKRVEIPVKVEQSENKKIADKDGIKDEKKAEVKDVKKVETKQSSGVSTKEENNVEKNSTNVVTSTKQDKSNNILLIVISAIIAFIVGFISKGLLSKKNEE